MLNDPVLTAIRAWSCRRFDVWPVTRELGARGWVTTFVCSGWAARRWRRNLRRAEARAAKRSKAKAVRS